MKKHTNSRKFLAGAAATAVIVSAVPAAGFAASVELTDISGHWGEDSINYLVEKGAIDGFGDGTFKPNDSLTRGQAAKILAAKGLTVDKEAEASFADTKGHWSSPYVAAIQEQLPNVINGRDADTFDPNGDIKRQELAKMIVAAYPELELNENADVTFSDASSFPDWAEESIEILSSLGVVEGTNGKFNPADNVTRAQTAAFVHRTEVKEERKEVKEFTSGIAGFITEGTTRIEGATVSIGNKTVTTNEEGYFELFAAPGTHEVTIAANGYETKTVSEVEIQANEMFSFTKDMGMLIDTTAIEVTGVIVDSKTGSPLNAHVELEKHDEENDTWVPVAEVDATSGTYTINQEDAINRLELGAQYRHTVTMEGYKEFQQTISLDKEEVKNVLAGIELDAIETMNITGAVTDAEGNNVAEATVKITDSKGNTVTNGTGNVTDGVYSLEDLKLVSGTYHMVIDDKKSAAYNQEITVTEGSDLVRDVSLEEGNTITASFGTDALNDVFGTGAADEATLNFVMDRVAPGEYTLRLSGDYVITEEFSITVDGDETLEQRVTPAGTIAGQVTGSTEATVRLLDENKNIVATTKTENGTYSFTGVPAETYTIEASQKGFVTKESAEFAVEKNKKVAADVALDTEVTTGEISGFVRFDGTLAAVNDGATVSYYDAEGDEIKTVTVSDGAYSISSVEAGTYKVVVRGEGTEVYTTTQTIAAGDHLTAVNYNVIAGGDASLKINIVDAEGKPVVITGSTAELLDANVDAVEPAENVLGSNLGTITDSIITFENLSAGSYDLKLDVLDNKYIDVETVATLAAGKEAELTISLTEVADAHNVNFRVIDEDNENVENAYVVVFNEEGTIEQVLQTNKQGTQSLALMDGNYTLSVIQNGYPVTEQEVTVAGNEVTVPIIQLTK